MKSLHRNIKIQVNQQKQPTSTFKKLKFKSRTKCIQAQNYQSLKPSLSFKSKQFEKFEEFETWSCQNFRGIIPILNHCAYSCTTRVHPRLRPYQMAWSVPKSGFTKSQCTRRIGMLINLYTNSKITNRQMKSTLL